MIFLDIIVAQYAADMITFLQNSYGYNFDLRAYTFLIQHDF